MSVMDLLPQDRDLLYAWWDAVLRAHIASQIRAMRLAAGLSPSALGKRLGLSARGVLRLENPKAKYPSISMLRKIAEVFDVALSIRFEAWSSAVTEVANWKVPAPFHKEQSDAVDSPSPSDTPRHSQEE